MQTSQEFRMPSGATLSVTMSPYVSASALTKAILKCLRGLELTPDMVAVDLASLGQKPELLSQLLDKLLAVTTSDDVETAIFDCATRASYTVPGIDGSARVNRELFDDPKVGDKAREDHYAIFLHVVEVNCKPFFKQAFSKLATPRKTPAASLSQ